MTRLPLLPAALVSLCAMAVAAHAASEKVVALLADVPVVEGTTVIPAVPTEKFTRVTLLGRSTTAFGRSVECRFAREPATDFDTVPNVYAFTAFVRRGVKYLDADPPTAVLGAYLLCRFMCENQGEPCSGTVALEARFTK